MNKKPKLKPCPFCGGEAKMERNGAVCYCSCSKCGAMIIPFIASVDYCAKDKAAEAWNRRVENNENETD